MDAPHSSGNNVPFTLDKNGSCINLMIGSVTVRDRAGITGVVHRPFQISSMTISGHSVTAMHAAITTVAPFVLQPVSLVVLP